MDCLIPYTLADYDLLRPPGPDNPGGGVSTKYARCASIPGDLSFRRITTIPEVSADTVWADWLWFSPAFMGEGEDEKEERIEAFLGLDVQFKGISGTELNVLTWADKHRKRLIEGVDVITHVNAYHRQMYRYCGIEESRFLCDPVSEYLFYPARKVNRLVCMGQIGPHKRSELVVELFTLLKGTGIQTCYLGSGKMWGMAKNREYNELHEQIEAVADKFVENATEAQCAYWLNTSKYYAHVAWHDVSPISQRENALGGNVTFTLTHPGMVEVTPYRYQTVAQMAEGILAYHADPKRFRVDSQAARDFGMRTNSYQAWRQQLLKVLDKPDYQGQGAYEQI